MPEQDRTARFIQALPKYLLLFTILLLLTLYILIWLVDFKQVYVSGVTEWTHQFPAPIFWLHIFREGLLVENLQWLFLGLSAVLSYLIYIKHSSQRNNVKLGWLLLATGLLIMLLEDSINLRYKLSYFLSLHFYDGNIGNYEWFKSSFRTIVELSVYAILGSVMISSYYYLFRSGMNKFAFRYLTGGFIVYAIAAFCSATRNIGSWYEIVGINILDRLTEGLDLFWNAESMIFLLSPLGFYFMDHVVEESLELIGATLILCFLISVIQNK